ncbi:MAG: hypothetical protein ACKVVP_15095 [Chloroflexota bacterium]
MIEQQMEIRPGQFCQFLLRTLESAEAQTKRRKRDQTPDRIGLGIRRELLERAIAENPEPELFETWLMTQVLSSPQPGPTRAMAVLILNEFRFAQAQPEFRDWLLAGAPSADADEAPSVESDAEVTAGDRRLRHDFNPDEHWCPICTSDFVRDG